MNQKHKLSRDARRCITFTASTFFFIALTFAAFKISSRISNAEFRGLSTSVDHANQTAESANWLAIMGSTMILFGMISVLMAVLSVHGLLRAIVALRMSAYEQIFARRVK